MKYWKYAVGGIILILLIGWSFMPRPASAEITTVSVGPLTQTVAEDGFTRVVDRYRVVAPINGNLVRIIHRPGDVVKGTDTLLATIMPADATLLDQRGLAEAKANVKRAEAELDKVREELRRAKQAHQYAETERNRLQRLAAEQTISQQALDAAENEAILRSADERAAEQAVAVARFNLEQAQATLLQGSGNSGDKTLSIVAPVDGKIFAVFRDSAGFVSAGTLLLELGDPQRLEVVVDLLSQEAVKVRAGQTVTLTHWGGEQPLGGRVRLVEPSGFTKVSALGVEEQRVNVVIDITDPPTTWAGLADGFRVEVDIEVWRDDDALRVPTTALFRKDQGWAVFAVEGNKAQLREVRIGRRNSQFAELLDGLADGERVIVHPSDDIQDGVRVEPQTAL